jgi:HNH endonuclease.
MSESVYYSHQAPDNPEAQNNFEFTMLIHQRWAMLLNNRADKDADTLIVELQRITGQSRHQVDEAMNAMEAMDRLPRLRIVQENHYFLPIAYLARIMKAVAQASPEHVEELDSRIVERLTPRSAGEVLPAASVIARLITMWIKQLDPTFTGGTGHEGRSREYLQIIHRDGMTWFRGVLTGMTGKRFHAAVSAAGDSTTSLVEGLRALLESRAPVRITQYLFTPLTGGVSWMPQVGYLSQRESVEAATLVEQSRCIDEVATRVEKGYTPSALLRAYVIARDGVCRHPGCTVSADLCDVDHVVPFGHGGVTASWNLQCLCRRHHNMKTDRRLRAEIDCVGDVRWIGPCNTPMVTRPSGPLSQEMPTGRWGQVVRARMDQRFAFIRSIATSV